MLLAKILAEHGFTASTSEAKRLIVGGLVYVDLIQVTRPELHIPIGVPHNIELRSKHPIVHLITVKGEGEQETAVRSEVGRTGVLKRDVQRTYGVHPKGTRVRVTSPSPVHRGLYEAVGIDLLGNVIYDDSRSARVYVERLDLNDITFDPI